MKPDRVIESFLLQMAMLANEPDEMHQTALQVHEYLREAYPEAMRLFDAVVEMAQRAPCDCPSETHRPGPRGIIVIEPTGGDKN